MRCRYWLLIFLILPLFPNCSGGNGGNDYAAVLEDARADARKVTATADEKEEIEGLIEQLYLSREQDLRNVALRELVSYGQKAIPQLSESPIGTYSGSYALRALGEIGPEALPIFLEKMTRVWDPADYQFVFAVVSHVTWDPVPGLMDAIVGGDKDIRDQAYSLMTHIASRAGEAIPFLFKRLEIEEKTAKYNPAEVLAAIASEEYDMIPQLQDYLYHEDMWVRSAAAYAFQLIGSDGRDAAPALREYLEEHAGEAGNSCAASALSDIDPSYLDGLAPDYLDLLGNENEVIRIYSTATLGYFGNQPGVLTALIEALEDEDYQIKTYAVRGIGNAGTVAGKQAVDALRNAFNKGNDCSCRALIIKTLGRFGPTSDIIDLLIDALNDDTAMVREAAALVLASYGPASETAVPHLIEAMKSEYALDPTVDYDFEVPVKREYYALALGKIGPSAKPALPALFKALRKGGIRTDRLRIASALAIHRISQVTFKDAAAQGYWPTMVPMPILTKFLDDADPSISVLAADAIGNIGPDAASALPELREIAELDDPDPICLGYVEDAARKAIEKIDVLDQ